MSYYMLPALAGLVLKLVILAYAWRGRKTAGLLVSLLLIFALHNAIEFVGYSLFLDHQAVETLFRTYYVVTVFGLAIISLLAFETSKNTLAWINYGLFAIGTLLAGAIMFSDLVVAGHYSIGYAATAVQGEYYAAFAIYCLIALLTALGSLIYGWHTATTPLQATRCLYSLMAVTPVLFIGPLVLILNMFGIFINAAGLIPLATTFFVYVVIKGESDHQLTDIRRFLPFSNERRLAARFSELTDAYAQSSNQENAYADLRDGIERQAILYTFEKCGGNISESTRMMGLQNRSTLYSMMKRLGIEAPSSAKAKAK